MTKPDNYSKETEQIERNRRHFLKPMNFEDFSIDIFSESDISENYLSWLNDSNHMQFSDQQLKVVTSFLSDTLGKWVVGSGGEDKFRDLYTEVSVDEDYFSVKTYGKASFKLSTESICLI